MVEQRAEQPENGRVRRDRQREWAWQNLQMDQEGATPSGMMSDEASRFRQSRRIFPVDLTARALKLLKD